MCAISDNDGSSKLMSSAGGSLAFGFTRILEEFSRPVLSEDSPRQRSWSKCLYFVIGDATVPCCRYLNSCGCPAVPAERGNLFSRKGEVLDRSDQRVQYWHDEIIANA